MNKHLKLIIVGIVLLVLVLVTLVPVPVTLDFEKDHGDVSEALIEEIEVEYPISENEKRQTYRVKLWRYLIMGPAGLHKNKVTYKDEGGGIISRAHEVSFPAQGGMYISKRFEKVNGKWRRTNEMSALTTY